MMPHLQEPPTENLVTWGVLRITRRWDTFYSYLLTLDAQVFLSGYPG